MFRAMLRHSRKSISLTWPAASGWKRNLKLLQQQRQQQQRFRCVQVFQQLMINLICVRHYGTDVTICNRRLGFSLLKMLETLGPSDKKVSFSGWIKSPNWALYVWSQKFLVLINRWFIGEIGRIYFGVSPIFQTSTVAPVTQIYYPCQNIKGFIYRL